MRVLISTTGYPGHVLPLVPFAHALVRAGHDLCVAAPGSHGALVRDAGLRFIGCGSPPADEIRRIMARAAKLPREQGHALIISEAFAGVGTRAMLADLLQIIGAWRPDIVLRESQEFAALLAAEHHAMPHARVGLGLGQTEVETILLAAPAVDRLGAELKLPADPRGERIRSAPYLTLVPGELDNALPADVLRPLRFRDPRPRRTGSPEWLPPGGRPLVYMTFGSVAATLGFYPGVYRQAIDALAGLPIRLLVTVGGQSDPAELEPLPAHVRVERWLPQAEVVPHIAAVVSHGGYGTTLGALAAGVPLVLMPLFAGDQWQLASRVGDLGAGIVIDDGPEMVRTTFERPPGDTIAELGRAVSDVLTDPSYRRAAGTIAGAIGRLPPVEAAADLLRAHAAQAGAANRTTTHRRFR
jgi:UDP:flavonoid glycosyltransferase YjiC (YdhE family)